MAGSVSTDRRLPGPGRLSGLFIFIPDLGIARSQFRDDTIQANIADLLGEHGFQWAASGESVYRNSIKGNKLGGQDADYLHRGCRFGDNGITCYFRDDGLSDLIGFTYADWHADDAVANLVHHLEAKIRRHPAHWHVWDSVEHYREK